MKFDEIVNIDGRELYVSGSYDQKREAVDCVGWISGGIVHTEDIYDYITLPSLIHITEVFEYDKDNNEVVVDINTLDLSLIREIIANQLNNNVE